MQVVLDPLSPTAQRLAPLLVFLRNAAQADIELLLAPATELTSLPLKSYYAVALPQVDLPKCGAEKQQDESAGWGAPQAHFPRVPQDRVLTMGVDVPESWLVEVWLITAFVCCGGTRERHACVLVFFSLLTPRALAAFPSIRNRYIVCLREPGIYHEFATPVLLKRVASKGTFTCQSLKHGSCMHRPSCNCCSILQVTQASLDTDNLRLSALGTSATFHVSLDLEALLITGTCVDVTARKQDDLYPRGTQLVLQPPQGAGESEWPQGATRQDTLVMSNLGYFQLKAAPGVPLSTALYRCSGSTSTLTLQNIAQ